MSSFLRTQLEDSVSLLKDCADILGDRATGAGPPPWCVVRQWDAYLLALDDTHLHAAEHGGALPAAGMPPTLAAHLERVARVAHLPPLVEVTRGPAMRRAGPQKRVQVAAFVEACRARLPAPSRVVDVGSGHGHLTRSLSAAWHSAAVGVDWNARLLRTARTLSTQDGVAFVEANALAGLPAAGPGDVWVGLHACGALGDALVRHALAARVPLALVGCCPQKTDGPFRAPFDDAAPVLGRAVLGLANVTPRATGVEVDVQVDLAARTAREAVLDLLRQVDASLAPGEEMRGVNRRVARRGIHALAAAAFLRRAWPVPTETHVNAAWARAVANQARARRLAVPRVVLGRAVEVFLALDRAAALHTAGFAVEVGTFVLPSCTPRNIMVVARPRGPGAGGP